MRGLRKLERRQKPIASFCKRTLKLCALFLICFMPLQQILGQSQSNVLIYGDNVQVSSQVNEYENIVAGTPIQGTVMITHASTNPVDPNSFRMGEKPLQV